MRCPTCPRPEFFLMTTLLVILIPILIADVMNPVLLAAQIYVMGKKNPYRNVALFLLGWFVAYLVAGIVLAIGLDAIVDRLQNPKTIDYVIQLGIGIALLCVAFQAFTSKGEKPKREFKEPSKISPVFCFLFGAQINIVSMPFAIPYFGALDQIMKADLSLGASLSVLVLYNVLYVLPFALLVLVRWIYREKGDLLLQKVNTFMEKMSACIMPVLLVVLGIALLVDGVGYFFGKPLFAI